MGHSVVDERAVCPYGLLSTNSDYGSPVNVWKVFNRTASGSSDCGCSGVEGFVSDLTYGWYIDWICYDGLPMVPIEVKARPRVGMSQSWRDQNNPEEIKFWVIKTDGSIVEVGHHDNLNWSGDLQRTFHVSTDQAGIGFRMSVMRTKTKNAGEAIHCCWSYILVSGASPTCADAVGGIDGTLYQDDEPWAGICPMFRDVTNQGE